MLWPPDKNLVTLMTQEGGGQQTDGLDMPKAGAVTPTQVWRCKISLIIIYHTTNDGCVLLSNY